MARIPSSVVVWAAAGVARRANMQIARVHPGISIYDTASKRLAVDDRRQDVMSPPARRGTGYSLIMRITISRLQPCVIAGALKSISTPPRDRLVQRGVPENTTRISQQEPAALRPTTTCSNP